MEEKGEKNNIVLDFPPQTTVDVEKTESKASFAVEKHDEFTQKLLSSVLIAVLSGFLSGYNTIVLNVPDSTIFPGRSTVEWALAVSFYPFGGIFGAMAGGTVSGKFGRKGALVISAGANMIGGVIMASAPHISALIVGRAVTGAASGITSAVMPLYFGEIAPPSLRGPIGILSQFSLISGLLTASLIQLVLSQPTTWRFLVAIVAFVAFFQLAFSPFMVETPTWLLSRDSGSEYARNTLASLRGKDNDSPELIEELRGLLSSISFQKQEAVKNQGSSLVQQAESEKGILWKLFSDKQQRIFIVSALVLHSSQQLCGINAVFYYSTSFFKGTIADPKVGTVLIVIVNLITAAIPIKVVSVTTRRFLMMQSGIGMFVSCILMIIALYGKIPTKVALAAVMLYCSFFETGFGPIPWVVVPELFDPKYAAIAMSIASQVNWFFNFAVGITFPFLAGCLGPWTFGPYAIVIILCTLFTYFFLPETSNKTHREVLKAVETKRRNNIA